jgi:glycosyltransferase involved in cell wall biosynthesis
MDKPLVTIITPTYNHEKYIGECIESVLNQTYENWEQYIIDDGSKDNTEKVAKKYKDERINYIKKEHEGIENLKNSYNLALKKGKGSLVAILEGDDKWPLDKLEKQVPYFDNEDIVLTWGRGILIDNKSKELGYTDKPKYKNSVLSNKPKGTALRKLLKKNFITPAVSIMIRKNSLIEINGFSQPKGTITVDIPTWIELSLIGRFYFIDDVLAFYRKHIEQVTNKYSKKMIFHDFEIKNYYLNKLSKNMKKKLKINDKEILSYNNYLKGIMYLDIKSWGKARENLFNSFKYIDDYNLKFKSFIGLIGTFIKTNFKLIRGFKRKL